MDDAIAPGVVLRLNPATERYVKLRDAGIIMLDGEVNDESYWRFCEEMLYLYIKQFTGPIWIILNSVGGDVYGGLGIYDIIKAFVEKGKEVNVLGVGLVASMAAIIVQAGSKRISLPHTRFLLHQISEGFVLKSEVSQSEERVAEVARLNKSALNIIAERSRRNIDEVIELVKKRNFWLDAKEALDFRLIDEVAEEWPF